MSSDTVVIYDEYGVLPVLLPSMQIKAHRVAAGTGGDLKKPC